jgi:hypothetical protein
MKRMVLAAVMGMSLVAGPALAGGDGLHVSREVTEDSRVPRHGQGGHDQDGVKKGQPTIYGKTYGEWSATWFQWAYAGPEGANAVEDETGELCAVHQPQGKVWFLAGSFGLPSVQRTCTIPPNRALLYPLINISWTDCPGTPDEDLTDAQVRDLLATSAAGDLACQLTSTLDGAAISSLQILTVRTQSPNFTTILPEDSVITGSCVPPLPPGQTGRQIAEGYWVMLPPLSPGTHTLTLHGAGCDAATGDVFFENGVTYDLTVLSGHYTSHEDEDGIGSPQALSNASALR